MAHSFLDTQQQHHQRVKTSNAARKTVTHFGKQETGMKVFSAMVGLVLAAGLTFGAAAATASDEARFLLTTQRISPGHSTITSLQQEHDFWGKTGIDVTISSVEGSTAAIQQLASGNAEFATVAPEVVFAAREQGIDVVAVYQIVRSSIFRVMVDEASDIVEPADLRGKTIGVPGLASATYPFARTLVASAGLDPDTDVSWLPVGVGPRAALALQQDQVQALSTWDTAVASLANGGFNLREVSAPYQQNLLGQVLVVRSDYLEENPDAVAAVAKGIAQATMYALANPEETVETHWKHYPQSKPQSGSEEELMSGALAVLNARVGLMEVADWPETPYGMISDEKWAVTLDAAVDRGEIGDRDAAMAGYSNALIEQINAFELSSALSP
jgi:NitT/TauT family transport system substrate-binding protein